MRTVRLIGIVFLLFLFGCNKSAEIEIKDVCRQPGGTKVTIQGYLSLPNNLERIGNRDDKNSLVSYGLFLMSKPDAGGDKVRTIFRAGFRGEPNRIKILPEKYLWNDLIAYTHDGKISTAGQIVKLTGEVISNSQDNCDVNVTKIETP